MKKRKEEVNIAKLCARLERRYHCAVIIAINNEMQECYIKMGRMREYPYAHSAYFNLETERIIAFLKRKSVTDIMLDTIIKDIDKIRGV